MAQLGPVGKSLLPFGFLYTASFVLLWVLFRTFPNEWSAKKQFLFIFSVALLCRIFFLTFPASYDVNRYIWEGYVYNQGLNPYLHPPDDIIFKPIVNPIWHDINHKDASACYPPMVILLFSFMAAISQSPLFFKTIIILFDLAVIPVLALIAKSRNMKFSGILLYALNPLVLVFIAGEGHLDSLQAFFLCISLYHFVKNKDGRGFFFLGCAVMSKYYALVLLPFVINRKNWKKVYALAIPLLFYLPFSDSGLGLFTSLITFGTTMHYNDSLTVVLRAIFGSNAVWVSLLLLSACLTVIFLVVRDPLRSSYLSFASLLLFIPTLHPWYLILVTPLLVFFPSRAWLFFHFAVVFTFPVLQLEYRTGVFQEIHWLKIFEFLPFFVLLVFDFITQRPFPSQPLFRSVKNCSVVIPAVNEAKIIANALESVSKEKRVVETIVVDGGSSDGTQEVARILGARVVEAAHGRGVQISTGVSRCHGDIILVLHADCCIVPGVFERIINELNRNPHCIGGSLGMRYQTMSIQSRFLALLNNGRARWARISFGDQGQFFRKEALDIIDGFPRQMLMEDVELSLRLKENGVICYIPRGIVVSHRRWEAMNFFANFIKVITLCFTYLVKRRLGLGDSRRKGFYERYYATRNPFM